MLKDGRGLQVTLRIIVVVAGGPAVTVNRVVVVGGIVASPFPIGGLGVSIVVVDVGFAVRRRVVALSCRAA